MSILITVVLTLVFCLTPALVLWLCRRFPLLGKVGPIMVLYAIGMIIGNLPVLPAEIKPLQDMIPNIMVPLAIPMMLFGCTFSRKELRLQVKLCASGFLSVCIAVVVGYLLFGRNVEQGAQLGGIMSGMYTGGMVNQKGDFMLTKEEFHNKIAAGIRILDGATGSNLQKMGMPRGCCAEEWILHHPEKLVQLQRAYAQAGTQILYAPTFQAQPIALERVGLHKQTEAVNAHLAALSRSAAPGCLVAGDITTLAAFCDSWDENNFDLLVENYRRQIRGLMDGGVDLLVGETLLYPQEAEAILCAAELEGAGASMYSFTMQPDGALFSGREAGPVLRSLEEAGAAAVGFNCVAADEMTPHLVSRLRRYVKCPILCKPNAGMPTIGDDQIAHYDMSPAEFGRIAMQCIETGASLVGGCCGTTPDHIRAIISQKAL